MCSPQWPITQNDFWIRITWRIRNRIWKKFSFWNRGFRVDWWNANATVSLTYISLRGVLDLTAWLLDCSWYKSISSWPNPTELTALPIVQTVCAKKPESLPVMGLIWLNICCTCGPDHACVWSDCTYLYLWDWLLGPHLSLFVPVGLTAGTWFYWICTCGTVSLCQIWLYVPVELADCAWCDCMCTCEAD